jgi:hypothetical protein
MSRLEFYGVDTPEKQRIADLVREAVLAFLRAGARAVEQACNRRRLAVLDYLRALSRDRHLPEWGLPNITVEVAMQEASPQFVLADAPDPLRVNLRPNRHPRSPDASMSYDCDRGVILIHLPALALIQEGKIQLIVWHEMLHACGDLKPDGIVRHNKIGVDAVLQLVTGGCPGIEEPSCT